MGAPDEHLQQELAKTMREGIGSLYKSLKTPEVVIGRAINVTDTLCDIDRGEGSPGMSGVRLNALEEATGTYATIVPKENSWVLVAVIEDDVNEGVIIATTEIEKIIFKCGANTTYLFTDGTIKSAVGGNFFEINENAISAEVGDSTIEITADSITAEVSDKRVLIEPSHITLNDGSNGSLIVIQDLVNKINRLEAKVDDLTIKHNGLQSNYNGHTHVYSPGPGTPTPTAVPVPLSANTSTAIGAHTTVNDIENPDVKH